MFDPVLKIWSLKSPILWVDFCVSILLAVFVFYILVKVIKRKTFVIAGTVVISICFIAWFFGLELLWFLCILCMTSYFTASLIQNNNEVRDFMVGFAKKKGTSSTQKVYDRHAVCQKIALAVETLSKTKTGALITFEKGMDLSEYVKTGTILHSPVTPELLITIFYPGTRLHDGAVVIRRDEILAASVYYSPTTKPLTGKFGSRHRAAIGISEVTDSVTIIVSEETGRVSIAFGGELTPVAPDRFLRTLEEFLFAEEKQKTEEEK